MHVSEREREVVTAIMCSTPLHFPILPYPGSRRYVYVCESVSVCVCVCVCVCESVCVFLFIFFSYIDSFSNVIYFKHLK